MEQEKTITKKWYVIHTYSGFEGKVRDHIRERVNSAGYTEKVGRILVPTEDVVEIRGGRKIISTRKFFPGYVMIELDLDDDIWYLIKNTPKVTGFLGDAAKPVPMSDEEARKLLDQIEGPPDKPKPKVAFSKGEGVRVTDGPFTNFSGVIEEVDHDKGKLKLMVSIFGRPTPVELEFSQVEKI